MEDTIFAIRYSPDCGWEFARVVPTDQPEWFALLYPDLTLRDGMRRLFNVSDDDPDR